jgi:hypothetical protein
MGQVFILFDARAAGGVGTDNASVACVCVCDTESEARDDAKHRGSVACYQYDQKGKNLVNERWLWDS